MVGKKSSKRSTLYNKGTNATLDQFFTVKNKNIENNTPTITPNENDTKNITTLSSDIKQQKKKLLSPPSSKSLSDKKGTESLSIKQQRRPLADIGGKSAHALTMMPTMKPAKPSFTVLRDDDIEQGATEAEKQLHLQTQTGQSILSPPSPTDESNTPEQKQQLQTIDESDLTQQQTSALNDDDDGDTQDSQASSLGGSIGSFESFFDDDDDSAIEFRVDALGSDDDDDDDDDNNDDNNATSSSFFDDDDDDDEPPFLTRTHRRTHLPTATTPSIPNKRALENKGENETHNSRNKMIKSSHLEDTNTSPPSATTTEETDDQTTKSSSTLEFSISNSLTIPLNIKDNYYSSSEEEDNDTNSPPPPPSSAASAAAAAVSSPVTSTTSQQQSSESQTPQLQHSQSSRTSELSTLPMSLPLDESIDLHVAYPVPRGKQMIDKFGH